MSDAADNTARRQRGRPWPKGTSGNPKGPGTGSRNRASLLLDRMAEGEAEAVLRSVLAAAKAGDMAAAKVLLDRVWPARKGRPMRFALPALESLADVPRATAAIAAAVAAGELTTDEAAGLAGVLAAHVRAAEVADLEARIAALEAVQPQGNRR